jgi:hypothetical protein
MNDKKEIKECFSKARKEFLDAELDDFMPTPLKTYQQEYQITDMKLKNNFSSYFNDISRGIGLIVNEFSK